MLVAAAWILLAPAVVTVAPGAAATESGGGLREPELLAGALPGTISRLYLAAQGALRQGEDAAALTSWKKARAQFEALPAELRFSRDVRDATVRYELRLAEIARTRFDRIRSPLAGLDEAMSVQEAVAEKRRLFSMLAGEPTALGADGFAGALRYVADLNPTLRGVHCQRAELIARLHRWLGELPCASELSDGECEQAKTRAAADDTVWRADVARAQGACRGSL